MRLHQRRPSRGRNTDRHARTVMIESLEARRMLSATLYVDASAPGPVQDGSSWADAYADLQQALAAANAGDQIHVAGGTYKPTSGNDRTATFQLKNGVALYGGYAGLGAADPDARDVAAHPSVLSGDIGSIGDNTDNSYHVVTGSSTDATAVLDGFTVTAGRADATAPVPDGSGMLNNSGSPSINNCIFSGNYGGMSNYDHSSPTLIDCDFIANYGGGIYNDSSSPTLTDCAFHGNLGQEQGTIANTNNSAPTITNCIFSGNAGLGMYNYSNSGAPTLTNCTFAGNAVRSESSAAPVLLFNSIVWGNGAGGAWVQGPVSSSYCDVEGGLPGTGNINADPHFLRNPNPGPDGIWGTADDDYGDLRVQPYSPVADAGNNAVVPAGVTSDFGGSPRFQDVPTTADSGAGIAPVVDIGAYEAIPALAATAVGPYIVLQGAAITLSPMAASDAPGTLRYDWDFNADGIFGDATGQHPVFSNTGALGTIPIAMRITDGASHSVISTTTITVLPAVLYVDASAHGTGDGLSWANAFTSLQTALSDVVAGEGQTIRVADGTYTPTAGNDRTASFRLKSGVSIEGGYAGSGAADPDARDVTRYPTILSGDIGVTGDNSDNSLVLVAAGRVDHAVLDGFSITGASGSSNRAGGIGVFAAASSLTLAHCTISDNFDSRAANGGGIVNWGALTLEGCTISGNVAADGYETASGGGINNIGTLIMSGCVVSGNVARGVSSHGGGIYNTGTLIMSGCVVSGNAAASISGFGDGTGGGGIYNYRGTLIASDCTISQNLADNGGFVFLPSGGGGIYNLVGSVNLNGCTVSGNSAGWGIGGGLLDAKFYLGDDSSAAINNSIVWGNSAYESQQLTDWGPRTGWGPVTVSVTHSDIQGGFAGAGNINADPKFVRNPSPGPDGQWGTADDDYGDLRLQADSPCIDAGDNSVVPAGITTDLAGKPRFVDFPGVNDPGAIVDMGAYERGPVGTVRFSTTAISVNESGGAAQVTLSRVGGSEGACSVDLLIGGGTSTEGLDYVAPATQTLSFADGEVTKTISIPILEDRLFEGDETVNLALANPAGGTALETPSQATLTIVDDDHFDGSGRTLSLEKKKFSNLVIADFVNTNFTSPAGLRATIDWGDGSSSAGTIMANPSGGGFEVLGTQKYRRKGTYQVRIVITDADGAQLALTGSITVGDKD